MIDIGCTLGDEGFWRVSVLVGKRTAGLQEAIFHWHHPVNTQVRNKIVFGVMFTFPLFGKHPNANYQMKKTTWDALRDSACTVHQNMGDWRTTCGISNVDIDNGITTGPHLVRMGKMAVATGICVVTLAQMEIDTWLSAKLRMTHWTWQDGSVKLGESRSWIINHMGWYRVKQLLGA